MKPGLSLWIEPGQKIDEAARQAQLLADQTQRAVGFLFNSVRCVAWPGGDAERLSQAYHDALASELVVYSNSLAVEIERKSGAA